MFVTPSSFPGDGLTGSAFEVVRPAYGSGSLADLLPSVAAHLGVPGTTDVLGLAPWLDGVDRVGVLLVDGLGTYQLDLVGAQAPHLAELPIRSLTTGFPSTTPVSLATLGTGRPPGVHGIVGFTVRGPGGRIVNHIHWDDEPDPRQWQPEPTVYERAALAGLIPAAVVRPEFEGSGLTEAVQRGAKFIGAAEAPEVAAGMVAAFGEHRMVYGYYRDLDRFGHEDGVGSASWTAAAGEVGDLVRRLAEGLPADTAVLVTADHGQLNVPAADRIDLSVAPELAGATVAVAGEPRVRYLYAAPGAVDDLVAGWRAVLGDSAWVLTREEAIDGGWFGPVAPAHASRLGDVVIICLGRRIVLAGDYEPAAVGRLVAYHGSVTAAEMTVPLMLVRGS